MKYNISSLCVNVILILISNAVALKLVPGESSIIKKDGATHTISRYYVVPNDFDGNQEIDEQAGGAAGSDEAIDYVLTDDDEGINRAEESLTVNGLEVDVPDSTAEAEVSVYQANRNIDETEVNDEAFETQRSSVSESIRRILGNLEVQPNNIPIDTVNISNTIGEKTSDEISFQTTKLTDHSIAKIYDLPPDRIKILFQNYVNVIKDPDEKLKRIEKLYRLLNIVERLNTLASLKIANFGDIVDVIDRILYKPGIVSKITLLESKDAGENGKLETEKDLTVKCQQILSQSNVDLKGVSVSETDGRVASNNIMLLNDNLHVNSEGRDGDNVNILVNMPSNKIDSTQVVNSQTSQLVSPYYAETENQLISETDGLNLRSLKLKSGVEQIVHENYDFSTSTGLPYVIEDKNRISRLITDVPYAYEETHTNNLPISIKSKVINNLPYTIEDNISNNVYDINDEVAYSSNGFPVYFEDNIGNEQVNIQEVKSTYSSPSVYKYLFKSPESSNKYIKLTSENYSNNLAESVHENLYETNSELILKDKPSYYKSEVSFSEEPGIVFNNKPSYYASKLNIEKHIDPPVFNNKIITNPLFVSTNVAPNYQESTLKFEYDKETEINSDVLLPSTDETYNTHIKVNFEKNYNKPAAYQEYLTKESEILLPNIPSNLYESKLNIGIQKDKISSTIYDTLKDNDPVPVPLDMETSYGSEVKFELDKETVTEPNIWNYYSPAFESDYIKLEKDYNIPLLAHNRETYFNTETIHSTPSHESEYIKVEEQYNSPTFGYVEEKNINAELLFPNNVESYKNDLELIEKPSIIDYQPLPYEYQQLALELPSSYQLFALENLLRLRDVLLQRKLFNSIDVLHERSLTNLNNIITIFLKLAEHFGSNEGNNVWYENLFYKVKPTQHPLEDYVYNLLRQKWLHELMLLLHHNNYNLNILNIPAVHSLLATYKFPYHVIKFLETDELTPYLEMAPIAIGADNFINENVETTLGNNIIENYVTENKVDNYLLQNEALILSLTEIEPGLDANAIIDILQRYLLHKSYIENQEDVINRGNMLEMFKHIVIFLKERGYGSGVILDLIRQLHGFVSLAENSKCNNVQQNEYVRNVFDVIVPILRSGR